MPLRALAPALGLVLAVSVGCSTLRTADSFPSGYRALGGVEVRVFESDHELQPGSVGPPDVVGRLEKRQDGAWRTIFRTRGSNWLVVGLAPGRYRVLVGPPPDRQGRGARSEEKRRVLDVVAGEISRWQVLLDDRPGAQQVGLALGAAALVAGAFLLEDSVDHEPVPPECLPDDAALVAEELEAAAARDELPEENFGTLDPVLFSHFPAAGAVVAGDHLRIVVALSQPLGQESIDPRAIVVRTAQGEEIPGRVGFDPYNWWLTWSPKGSLPAAAELRVTVSAPGATDWAGNDLTGARLFSFRTAS